MFSVSFAFSDLCPEVLLPELIAAQRWPEEVCSFVSAAATCFHSSSHQNKPAFLTTWLVMKCHSTALVLGFQTESLWEMAEGSEMNCLHHEWVRESYFWVPHSTNEEGQGVGESLSWGWCCHPRSELLLAIEWDSQTRLSSPTRRELIEINVWPQRLHVTGKVFLISSPRRFLCTLRFVLRDEELINLWTFLSQYLLFLLIELWGNRGNTTVIVWIISLPCLTFYDAHLCGLFAWKKLFMALEPLQPLHIL